MWLNGYIERPNNLPEEMDNELYWGLDVHGRFSFSGYIKCIIAPTVAATWDLILLFIT